jgi:hypothetical protein
MGTVSRTLTEGISVVGVDDWATLSKPRKGSLQK